MTQYRQKNHEVRKDILSRPIIPWSIILKDPENIIEHCQIINSKLSSGQLYMGCYDLTPTPNAATETGNGMSVSVCAEKCKEMVSV